MPRQSTLIVNHADGHETVRVEPWGPDSLRVRGTVWEKVRDDLPHALTDPAPDGAVPAIEIGDDTATITNGGLTAEISAAGQLRFLDAAGADLLDELKCFVTIAGLNPAQLKGAGADFVKRYKEQHKASASAYARGSTDRSASSGDVPAPIREKVR